MNEMTIKKPDYLINKTEAPRGLEGVIQHSVPLVIQVVQSLSKPPLKPGFQDGDIVITPDLTKISGLNQEPFTFTPLFGFTKYLCVNPMKATQLPFIRATTLDPTTELAGKCKDFGHTEPCPEMPGEDIEYLSQINFMVMLYHEESPIVPCLMRFMRGEFKTGQRLIGIIQNSGVDIWALRLRANSSIHTSKGNSWPGFDITYDPTRFVSEELYIRYEKLHLQLKKAIMTGEISTDDEDSIAKDSAVGADKF